MKAYVYPVNASGGLLAPVEDIARFISAGMTGSYYWDHAVLEQVTIRQIHTPEVDIPGIYGVVADSYGFGHFIETVSDGRQAVWHGGQGHGWMTHFHAIPEAGDGIVILTNSERSWPFMAQVLSDWARWNGLEPVKMSRITYATIALQLLIGAMISVSLWQVYRLLRGLSSGNRRLVPLSRISRKVLLLQALLGISVIAALAWAAAQPYLIVSSIFPVTAVGAGVSLLVLAIIVILSVFFPFVENE